MVTPHERAVKLAGARSCNYGGPGDDAAEKKWLARVAEIENEIEGALTEQACMARDALFHALYPGPSVTPQAHEACHQYRVYDFNAALKRVLDAVHKMESVNFAGSYAAIWSELAKATESLELFRRR